MLNLLSINQKQKIVCCHRYFVSLVIKKGKKYMVVIPFAQLTKESEMNCVFT